MSKRLFGENAEMTLPPTISSDFPASCETCPVCDDNNQANIGVQVLKMCNFVRLQLCKK